MRITTLHATRWSSLLAFCKYVCLCPLHPPPSPPFLLIPPFPTKNPYFNASHPDALNFGGAGVIMGHELTHGFDNQGKDYNGQGVLEGTFIIATSCIPANNHLFLPSFFLK